MTSSGYRTWLGALVALVAVAPAVSVGLACSPSKDQIPSDPTPDTGADPADSEVVIPPDEDADVDTGVDPGDTGTPPDDAAPPPPTYPAGPFGKAVGSVVPNLCWSGYHEGTGSWTKICLGDYFDPDGSRGFNAIKVNLAAVW
jgi:hypothetical protein